MSYKITRQQALERAPLLKAWGEGAKLQYSNGYGWKDCSEYGNILSDASPDIQYRIKPTLRPWRSEEVPVGAIVRDPRYNSVWLITALWEQRKGSGDYLVFLNGGNYKEGHKLEYFTDDKMEYSLDHGKTWQPCGVLE